MFIICPIFFFQYCQPAQNQPKSHILFHKNGSLEDFYIMTLCTLLSVIGQKMRRLCSSQMRKSKTIALWTDLSKTIQKRGLIYRLLPYQAKSKSIHAYYRHSLISVASISAIFDLTRFIILSYFPPLQYYILSNLDLRGFCFCGLIFVSPH